MKSKLFSNIQQTDIYVDEGNDSATILGISLKTALLLAITIIVSSIVAVFLPTILENNPEGLIVALVVASIATFISALVGRLSYKLAKYFSFIYAVCEGLLIGVLSRLVNEYMPNASFIAVFATLIIFAVMLALFSFGVIKAGNGLKKFAIGILISAVALILFTLIMSFIPGMDLLEGGYFGIMVLIEVLLLLYGVVTLTFNFQEAQAVVEAGCEKNAEWAVALGLMISFIYIYIYVLRLIILLSNSKK